MMKKQKKKLREGFLNQAARTASIFNLSLNVIELASIINTTIGAEQYSQLLLLVLACCLLPYNTVLYGFTLVALPKGTRCWR